MTARRLIVIGAGGHAKVVIDTARRMGYDITGVLDADSARRGTAVLGVPVIGDDSLLDNEDPRIVMLANAIGFLPGRPLRIQVHQRHSARGFKFPALIHPAAVIADSAVVAEGAQILARAVIQPDSHIGTGAIINTGALIDHDCRIGDHAHVAPGAVLCGDVQVGAGTHVGAGATIIQGLRIGAGAVIAAGATVCRDIPDGERVAGVPARSMGS